MFFSYIARNISTIFVTALILTIPISKFSVPFEVKEQIQKQISIAVSENMANSSKWEIEIPKINLKAEIYEGTSPDVMNKYIGHFEETSEFMGNIGLAAHNRGYPVNYFKDLKLLEIGDKIYYRYFGKNKTYLVNKIKIIKDTNWEMLKNTEENKLTLITCVENEPEYRLCVQAIEIGGNYEI